MSPKSPAQPLARLLEHAAEAVSAVQAGRSLTDALARVPAEARPGAQALAFHAMRWLGVARFARQALAPRRPAPWVDGLLLTALALAWPDSGAPGYAEHTLVDQAVRAARGRAPEAAGFVNALLRRFLRERGSIVAAAGRQPEPLSHPAWWVEQLRRDWPVQWQALLRADQTHPPMTLRTNRRRGVTAADYVRRLGEQGMGATALGSHAVRLDLPQAVQALPGFGDGDVSVQDLNAQRAAALLLGLAAPDAPVAGEAATGPALPAGARVLDACAAPGGKTAHLLECADLDLLALDHDGARLERVRETLDRLHLAGPNVRLQAADARRPDGWWDGRPFDAILIDAPCSGSGVVRRHPDIRWLRRADDLPALARVQGELLDALWPLLAPGGRLVYATCSVFHIEGPKAIDAFLQRAAAPSPRVDPASPGHLLPLADNGPPEGQTTFSAAAGDGFFYALLHKPL